MINYTLIITIKGFRASRVVSKPNNGYCNKKVCKVKNPVFQFRHKEYRALAVKKFLFLILFFVNEKFIKHT